MELQRITRVAQPLQGAELLQEHSDIVAHARPACVRRWFDIRVYLWEFGINRTFVNAVV